MKFVDFFQVKHPELTKVKFNMNAGNRNLPAWEFLLNDDPRWIEMNAHRRITRNPSNNLDKAQYLLAFAQYTDYGPDYFIFGGMYEVKIKQPQVNNGVGYSLTLMNDYRDLIKRLIIKVNAPVGRDVYCRWFNKLQSSKLNPEIYELKKEVVQDVFPGYKNVCLKHKDLQRIINSGDPSWKTALSNVSGVYCITDIATGKIYIGSAYGAQGLWQRWSAYANVKNLTGGNKAFTELKIRGANRIIDNFTYSILEVFDPNVSEQEVRIREQYWKKVFQSIKFGMNKN